MLVIWPTVKLTATSKKFSVNTSILKLKILCQSLLEKTGTVTELQIHLPKPKEERTGRREFSFLLLKKKDPKTKLQQK